MSKLNSKASDSMSLDDIIAEMSANQGELGNGIFNVTNWIASIRLAGKDFVVVNPLTKEVYSKDFVLNCISNSLKEISDAHLKLIGLSRRLADMVEIRPSEPEFDSAGFTEEDNWENYGEDRNIACSKEVIHPDAIFGTSGLYGTADLEYKIAETLGWLDMRVDVVAPAVEAIINNVPEGFDLLAISEDALFGLLLGYDDWAYEDLEDFIKVRKEIENEMRAGKSYKEAIDEWFK